MQIQGRRAGGVGGHPGLAACQRPSLDRQGPLDATLERLKDLAIRGIVDQTEFDAARAKQDAAKAKVESLTKLVEQLGLTVYP